MYLTPVWRSSTSLCRQAGLQVIGEGVVGGSFILYHTLQACWLDVPRIVCSLMYLVQCAWRWWQQYFTIPWKPASLIYLVYVECSEVLVTPTQGNGTLGNRMKMFGTDSVPTVWKQYCL